MATVQHQTQATNRHARKDITNTEKSQLRNAYAEKPTTIRRDQATEMAPNTTANKTNTVAMDNERCKIHASAMLAATPLQALTARLQARQTPEQQTNNTQS